METDDIFIAELEKLAERFSPAMVMGAVCNVKDKDGKSQSSGSTVMRGTDGFSEDELIHLGVFMRLQLRLLVQTLSDRMKKPTDYVERRIETAADSAPFTTSEGDSE